MNKRHQEVGMIAPLYHNLQQYGNNIKLKQMQYKQWSKNHWCNDSVNRLVMIPDHLWCYIKKQRKVMD